MTAIAYEYRRRILNETDSSRLDEVRSDILATISWLEDNKFQSFANDLLSQWTLAKKSPSQPRQKPSSKSNSSYGTGFSVSQDGFVLTAYHVVDGAKAISVSLSDGRVFPARLVRASKLTDLAVLQIEATTQNYLTLVSTVDTDIGDPVFTMGFPVKGILGEEPKYTNGTISALSGLHDESTFFQMSVPVQPGNSGGPVINEMGRVVGIVTSTAAIVPFLSGTGSLPQNINYAVKSDYAMILYDTPDRKIHRLGKKKMLDHVRKSICLVRSN